MDEAFIMQYSKLIYSVTHYFENYRHKEDLYQAGCLGLLLAYQNYDESYGVKFSTYAYPYILGEMKKLVREDKEMKVSKNILKLNHQIEVTSNLLAQQLGKIPSLREVADYLGLEIEELTEAKQAMQALIHLEAPMTLEENEVSLEDVIPSHQVDIDEWIAFKDEYQNLTQEEKKILVERYLLSKNQTEVATTLGMNQVQVSRFEKKIKEKIKQKMAA